MNQPIGVLRVKTTALILSVTVLKLWPGPMIGPAGCSGSGALMPDLPKFLPLKKGGQEGS
jgi:hypothetical protein